MPAWASASSSRRPAGPTNGAPSRSSRSPGCSPTNIATELRLPAPNTVCVACSHSGPARQPAAASRSSGSDGRDALLLRIADTVGDLIHSLDTLTIYEADETKCGLKPVLVRDVYADEIMSTTISFSEGITGWATRHREAVLSNQAHLDPRVRT